LVPARPGRPAQARGHGEVLSGERRRADGTGCAARGVHTGGRGGAARGARGEGGTGRRWGCCRRVGPVGGGGGRPGGGRGVCGQGVAGGGETVWPVPPVEPAEWLDADAVILATGGLSFPRTGSDGTGYALATSLGHTLVPPVPALTPLVAVDPLCRSAQGVTLDAELALWVDGRVADRVAGSLLFAHFGVTGPAALDL